MASEETMTDEQIRAKGIALLTEHLGPDGTMRFFQQTETGKGDYSKDRHVWLGNPGVKTIAAQIKASKNSTL